MPLSDIERTNLHRQRYPDRYMARYTAYNAYARGEIDQKPCRFCGSPESEMHHKDYSEPLDVVWACRPCHREQPEVD